MILGLQIIALTFALVMIYFSYLHYRRRELSGVEIFLLLAAWLGAILITIFPEPFSIFSRTIAITRAFDLAVIGGFIFVIPLVYISYVKTKRLEKKIEDYVRKEALNILKNEKKKN